MLAAEYPIRKYVRKYVENKTSKCGGWYGKPYLPPPQASTFLTGVKVEVEDNEVRMIATDIYG